MEKKKLENEISYLEKNYFYMSKYKKCLYDEIKLILESTINPQKNSEEINSTKNKLCEYFYQFKDDFEKLLESLNTCINKLKRVKTELESSDTKTFDEKNEYKTTLSNLEEKSYSFTTLYSLICETLVEFGKLLQKKNSLLKSSAKRLLLQFKEFENKLHKIKK